MEENYDLLKLYFKAQDIIENQIIRETNNPLCKKPSSFTLKFDTYTVYFDICNSALVVSGWSGLSQYIGCIPTSKDIILFDWLMDHFEEKEVEYFLTKIIIDGL